MYSLLVPKQEGTSEKWEAEAAHTTKETGQVKGEAGEGTTLPVMPVVTTSSAQIPASNCRSALSLIIQPQVLAVNTGGCVNQGSLLFFSMHPG